MYYTMLRPRHRKHISFSHHSHLQHHMPVSLDTISCLQRASCGVLISLQTLCLPDHLHRVPLLLRVCPTSSTFDNFVRRFETNYMRAAIYFIMSLIQWLGIIVEPTSLIAAAVVLLIASAFYALAGVKGQGFVGSKTLGGQGVAQMIV